MRGALGRPAALDGLAEVWGSLLALGRSLGAHEFELPTSCPGWTVKDQFSHVIGRERALWGDAVPPAGPWPSHVRNALGAANEAHVAARRGLPGRVVVEELAALVEDRLDALADLDEEARALAGPRPGDLVGYVDYVGPRVVEGFVHEQDVRLATSRPGGRHAHGERAALDHLEASMPDVLGRRCGFAQGTTVRLEVLGPLGRTTQLEVLECDGARRAVAVPVLHAPPAAVVVLDQEAFVRRACGRLGLDDVLARRTTRLEGDRGVALRVLEELVVTP